MTHPRPQSDGSQRSGQKPPEPRSLGCALPQHADDDRPEERRDEEAEERLHVVHDAGGMLYQVRGAYGNQHADKGAPAPHLYIMLVTGALVYECAINVIRP